MNDVDCLRESCTELVMSPTLESDRPPDRSTFRAIPLPMCLDSADSKDYLLCREPGERA